MRQFLITIIGTVFGIFAFILSLILIFVFIGGIGAFSESLKPKDSYILTLDMRRSMIDHDSGQSSLFGSTPTSVVSTVRALKRAKNDNYIKGVFIRAESFGMTPASAEELRLALLDFKESGKFVIAHAQGFETTSIIPFHAVSAADEIWMQDTTGFAVSGLRSESEFYGGVFEKFDAQPQIEQFYEYKNAANIYTQTGYTEAHKEATTSYLTSIYDNAMEQIAEDRSIPLEKLTAFFNTSPHSAEDAKAAGLVDKLGHIETAKKYAQKKAGGDKIKFQTASAYGVGINVTGETIAFIGGQGPVVDGVSSSGSPFNSGLSMGGDTIAKAFDAAIKDKKVKAIVFRVSTPGGSPAASDQILAATDRAKEAGKPVVISMGKYAASGGYYVSAHADHIVALPSTITGSIGVVGGKVAFEDTFAKIGYNIDGITIGGDYAGAYSADEPFNPSQREAYRGQLEDIYDDFTTRVANGRDIPLERVKEIAKGRVWTGKQAKEIGLVDELGGFFTAIEAAKKLAEIDEDTKIRIKTFPRPKTTQQQLEEILSSSVQMQKDIQALREITELPEVQAALRARQASKIGQELQADIPEVK